MDLLDVIIILVTLAAGIHGLRLGAAVQVLSFGGALVGLVCGVALMTAVAPHLQGPSRTFVSLVVLLVPCVLIWAIGRHLGGKLWGRMQGHGLAHLDAVAGAAIAMAGTLVFCWVVGSILVNSPVPTIADQIEDSAILRGVTGVMPPIPTEVASLERLLGQDGFPSVIGFTGAETPVTLPSSATVARAVAAAGRSTVQVVAYGCDGGELVEKGSGFVTDGDLVVTNAHVVAGADHIVVIDEVGDHVATPILFDPRFDLAVLRVPGLDDPSLRVDPSYVGRGTEAVVLGYPGGGPFNAQPAGVLERFDATGYDIYNEQEVTREIYEVESLVRPGNSGGPLVEPDGLVIGVVFSRSADNSRIGFALDSPGVLKRIEESEKRSSGPAVSTERCTSD